MISSILKVSNQILLLVCSTTLWVGQLDKKTQQSDVMSLLEEFGQIESINVSLDNLYTIYVYYTFKNIYSLLLAQDVLKYFIVIFCFLYVQMIPPRGCAYIVMVHRQDAYTALKKLSGGSYKVNQKPVKVNEVLQQ